MPKNLPRPLSGQTAVVTGAGSGIGQALAERLSAYGCPVVAVDVDADGLADTETRLNAASLIRNVDVRDSQALMALAAEVADWAPEPIGAVFNNAGVAMSASVARTPPEDHDWLMSINFGGVVNGTRAFLPILLRQGSGAIVNTSSVFGLLGIPYQATYCASKFAVRGFTDSLRQELRGSNVRAVSVHPGGIKTNIVRHARLHEDWGGESRDAAALAEEFDKMAFTTPAKAAAIIHRGVDTGRARILVGPDAYLFDAVARLAPARGFAVLERLQSLATGNRLATPTFTEAG
jgi:NAD(P)-dependent dehydrogenase (short-subunit alcohol dehydrogenase family)